MSYEVFFAKSAREDLDRLHGFLQDRDPDAAERALNRIEEAFDFLRETPFSCRKAEAGNPLLRELVVPFGGTGYVALFEIKDDSTIIILAVRHQREDDYH